VTILHFVTNEFVPLPGGLEVSLLRTAQMLAGTGAFEPVVYIRSALHDYADATVIDGVPIVPLGPRRAAWEEPLVVSDAGPRTLTSERSRLDYLLLRNLIGTYIANRADTTHALVSFFILEHGFVAQQVASALGVPHVACVRGTDFSRGFHDPHSFAMVDYVARTADLVLTTNDEQRRTFERRGVTRVRTIVGSVTEATLGYRWRPKASGSVRLFANCGYSHKKGTQVLLRAFAALRADGLPVELTITGADEEAQGPYWSAVRATYSARLPSAVTFLGHLPEDALYEHLLGSDIYCSASLGEGCSLARLTALAIGMPMVTTRCGEVQDLVPNTTHVRLSPVADEPAFTELLRRTCVDALAGTLAIDNDAVDRLRRYLTPTRERTEWVAALDAVLTGTADAETSRAFRS
jgi:glycosyltransferase involved in cell wall biosynthesis